jgi:hypothetical protein
MSKAAGIVADLHLESVGYSELIPSTWLCVFRPYHSIVMPRVRKARGYY